MPTTTTLTPIESAQQHLERAEKLYAKHSKAREDAWQAVCKARADLHSATIRSLVGQSVRRRFRSGYRPELNDALGTLVECRRTRCTVDYGDLGRFTFPIDRIAPADAEQGFEF